MKRLLLILLIPLVVSSDSRHLLGLRGGGPNDPTTGEVHASTMSELSVANITLPLHAAKGSHHVIIYAGSPPQRQTVILDSGSRLLAFPCKPCKRCGGHVNPYFDPKRSTTLRFSKCGSCLLEGSSTCALFGNRCTLAQRYTEGSQWSGDEVEDVVWFGTNDLVKSVEDHMQNAVFHPFGCQSTSKGLFREQYADGILGLALDDNSLVKGYHRAGVIPRNAFSLCMTPEGGTLSLGGTMPKEHLQEPMTVTRINRDHGLYAVEVIGIEVGNITLADSKKDKNMYRVNDGNGCLFDTGSTDTHLPYALKDDWERAVSAWTNGFTDFGITDREKKYTFEEFQKLPKITFRFANNASLSMQPQYYMEGCRVDPTTGQAKKWNGKKTLSNRIYLGESYGAVLGANAMYGYNILFDGQDYQIGLAKANCSAII